MRGVLDELNETSALHEIVNLISRFVKDRWMIVAALVDFL
jgi:hypothetical protein